MLNNVREQVTITLREFGLEPKGRGRTYQKPYLEFFYNVPYPRGFWSQTLLSSQVATLK
jgi:hypothetical protein